MKPKTKTLAGASLALEYATLSSMVAEANDYISMAQWRLRHRDPDAEDTRFMRRSVNILSRVKSVANTIKLRQGKALDAGRDFKMSW